MRRTFIAGISLLILSVFIILTSLCISQVTAKGTWDANFSEKKAFVENIGQFDKYSQGAVGDIKYVAELGTLRIFFGEKGLFYYFLEAEKTSKGQRDALMKELEAQEYSHKQKEHILGKYKFKSDEINMIWQDANEIVEITGEVETHDYHSYGVKDLSNGRVKNFNHARGFEKITYKQIYPSIDIIYEMHPIAGIKYSIVLHPGANPNDIKMLYDANAIIENNEIIVQTFFGDLKEHSPLTFYSNNHDEVIPSTFERVNGVFKFELGNYDNTQEVVIDPWVQTPGFSTSSAVWEVETDGFGNVYVIGGETPMELKKYNSTGGLQWTYTTPWDTSSVWLGTLATDVNGTSYITSGTVPEIERIDNAGGMIWHTNGPGGIFSLTEFWSITFNCDNTKLIVGGTGGGAFSPQSMIYDIDVNTGLVINDIEVGIGAQSGFTPVEVRSISSSKNAKYIFLTHKQVGAINQNIGFCPGELPVFEVGNADNLGYKCEDYLPYNQNGGGLKALVANDLFFYTHAGNEIHKWDLLNGALLSTVALPGGSAQVIFGGTLVVHNSGLAVDDCGNVYAGSFDRVVKFDANLNILAEAMVPFTVYDVVVNNNGEVLAVGAQGNNAAVGNRNGRLQSLAMGACAKYALICCDVNVCPAGPVCITDPSFALVPNTPGGTWSGVGVDASGNFDPAIAGVGTAAITYTLPCGSETIYIIVEPCDLPVAVCEMSGDLVASGGDGNYTWSTFSIVAGSTPISNQAECIACPTATPQYFFGFYTGCSVANCATMDTILTQFATGISTGPPPSYPVLVSDGAGATLTILQLSDLPECAIIPLTVELVDFELTCIGNKVRCEWTTINEQNNDYFSIERANSDGEFHEIGVVKSLVGNSNSETNYRFDELNNISNENYYRLFQTDFNGTKTGLMTKHINCANFEIKVYPNPFNDMIVIEIGDNLRNSNGKVEIINAIGQIVITQAISKNETLLNIDSQQLTKGIYFVRVFSDNLTFVEKVIKQ